MCLKLVLFREKESRAPSHGELNRHHLYFIPGIKIQPLLLKIPKKTYDYVLITSSNALRFKKKWPVARRWIAIGRSTQKFIESRISNVERTPKAGSEGVLKFFKQARGKRRASIFFPRSKIAEPKLIEALRKLGYRVCVRHSYNTQILSVRRPFMKLLQQKKIDGIYFTSPSTVRAFCRSFSPKERRNLPLKYFCIGETTFNEMKRLGLKRSRI